MAMRRARILCNQLEIPQLEPNPTAAASNSGTEVVDNDAFQKLMVKKAPAGTKVNKKVMKSFAAMDCREYVLIDGPQEGVKTIQKIKPKSGVTRKALFDHYFGKYSHQMKNAIAKALGPDRLRQVRYSVGVVTDTSKNEWAAVVELWAPDAKAMEAFQKEAPADSKWESLRELSPIEVA